MNADQRNQRLGTAPVPMTFFAENGFFPQPQGIHIQQTRGFGILLVDGNATLEGDVHWDGMILVTCTLFLNGQGSGVVIRGGVWAGRIEQSGPLSVQYDSCRLQAALLAVPTRVRMWREVSDGLVQAGLQPFEVRDGTRAVPYGLVGAGPCACPPPCKAALCPLFIPWGAGASSRVIRRQEPPVARPPSGE